MFHQEEDKYRSKSSFKRSLPLGMKKDMKINRSITPNTIYQLPKLTSNSSTLSSLRFWADKSHYSSNSIIQS